jgi:hypothetical protein
MMRFQEQSGKKWVAVAVLSAAGVWVAMASPARAQSAAQEAKDKTKEAAVAAKDAAKAGGEVVADAAKDAAKVTADAAKKTGKAMKKAASPASATADNTLTAKEKADGWKLLFDGKTTTGWRVYQKQGTPEGWKAVDGVLTRVDKEGDLITADQYENFELTIDWKIPEGANSGIFFHGVEKDGAPIYYSAPEYQLLDDDKHPDGKNGPTHQCGANYDLIAPSKKLCKPVGEWNTTRIVVHGPHVEHWLNGEKIVEYELWSDAWKELVAKSKFAKWPDYGIAKKGYIGLQEHGFKVEFKNIKVKVLPS